MTTEQIIELILAKRNISDRQAFLHPEPPQIFKLYPKDVGNKAYALIEKHINAGNKIIIYGDYDVDGLCSTAILWETLHGLTSKVEPFIPDRLADGYGLTITGIDKCLAKEAKLIITVDNGVTAISQVAYAHNKGLDVLIIDHHQYAEELPEASSIVHSLEGCAAALTWKFCQEYFSNEIKKDHLGLAALASVCDLVPLVGFSRSIVKHGLPYLRQTPRLGIVALCTVANIKQVDIDTYHCGFILGPRLNSTGRLENALTSLQLLCTKDSNRANKLALEVNQINQARQTQTDQAVIKALTSFNPEALVDVLVAADKDFHPGIIGLIAAKLTEKYTRPSIAIALTDDQAKASARSILGFDITKHIREAAGDFLTSVGGHAMAAGFSFESKNLTAVKSALESIKLDPDLLVKTYTFDLELAPEDITLELGKALQALAPFGTGNPTPQFQITNLKPQNTRYIGQSKKHVVFDLNGLETIWFNHEAEKLMKLTKLIGTINLKTWNGRETVQVIMKHGFVD